MTAPDLPIGFHRFHRDVFLNYQLNRAHSLGYLTANTAERGAKEIRRYEQATDVFDQLANEAEERGALAEAAACARIAEFFCFRPSSEQVRAYRKFRGLWDRAHADEPVQRNEVPYEGKALSTLFLPARGSSLGTVLVFGGFDSLIEEFFALWRGLALAGFDVVAFDGPGQGGSRTLHGQLHTHDWERPVAAVLDYFALSRATLVGLSMGGYWAIRAAGREPRVERVVSWPPVYDWLARFVWPVPWLVRKMVAWPRFMNWSIRMRMKAFPMLRHVVTQTCWLVGDPEPIAAARWFLGMNAQHIESARVTAPTFLMVGEKDRFQPPALARHQERALVRAPVTTRLFTKREQAQHHCQMGNVGLAVAELVGWLRRR